MTDTKKHEILHSAEYKSYIEALCRLASDYVPRIRRQFADKAFEMYQNETIRQLVAAYHREAKKLDESRLRDFEMVASDPTSYICQLEDTCLNHKKSYADTIKLFFLEM